MKNFKELREKTQKGIRIRRYQVDPSGMNIALFTKNTRSDAVRMLTHKDTLYVWDAYEMTHMNFLQLELLMEYGEALDVYNTGNDDISASFSPLVNDDEENWCGSVLYKKHGSQIEKMIKQYEKQYNCQYILVDSGDLMSWSVAEEVDISDYNDIEDDYEV